MARLIARLARWRRGGDDRGAELIELAMVLPLFMVVVAGIVDFGFLFQRYQVVTNAAREAARVGVLPGYILAGCAENGNAVTDRVHQYLGSAGLNPSAATVSVTCPTLSVGTGGATISAVRVVVDYPSAFAVLGPIAGMIGGSNYSSITLRAGSTMRMEIAATGS